MKHYFGYHADGTLASMETYGGGWPAESCLDNPLCAVPAVTSLRTLRAQKNPEIVGYVAYACDCPAEEHICDCCNDYFANHYVNTATKQFIAKPTMAVVVDGTQIAHQVTITKAPGAVVTLKLVAPDMPNGSVAVFNAKGPVELSAEPSFNLTFQNGETPIANLVAPAQGMKGVLFIGGKLIRPFFFWLRGFAT